ncbi:hypothetical protein [Aminobacter ciceronei]|uniref:Cilium assembly protein DZIP1 N-terminal domain-containing protein n=1 Tax=Aminobacter ciceronei TaxID=150723 RepID=A0ABR6CCH5_9HYPH|nr:hypothetical protein [Aminobacter ciceronei]MBA8908810.1 hypothetical protein [Aminobacter ciceronei]MBA9022711.1 hypothetical protein [Aminobacter ciceronei]
MADDDHDFDDDEERCVPKLDEIDWSALRSALTSLQMFNDPYLQMQATNLGIVDQFLTELEFQVLEESFKDDRDIGSMMFLNAQSQMWMFSAYELLRTWRQRIREPLDLLSAGKVPSRIDELLRDQGFRHYGMEMRAHQLQRVLEAPDTRRLMEEDLRITHVLYKQLDYLRVALAKHEVKGRRKSVALAPGYGRMDPWSGSLQYELEAGQLSLGTLSRRNVADGIRAFADRSEIPSPESLRSFDEYMKADIPDVSENFKDRNKEV